MSSVSKRLTFELHLCYPSDIPFPKSNICDFLENLRLRILVLLALVRFSFSGLRLQYLTELQWTATCAQLNSEIRAK